MEYPILEIKKTKENKFYFNAIDIDQRIIASSEKHETAEACKDALREFIKECPEGQYVHERNHNPFKQFDIATYRMRLAPDKQYYFNFHLSDNTTIAHSELHSRLEEAEAAMILLKHNPLNTIFDTTGEVSSDPTSTANPLAIHNVKSVKISKNVVSQNKDEILLKTNDLLFLLQTVIQNLTNNHNSLNENELMSLSALNELKAGIVNLIEDIENFTDEGDIKPLQKSAEDVEDVLQKSVDACIQKTIEDKGPELINTTGLITLSLGTTAVLCLMGVPPIHAAYAVFGGVFGKKAAAELAKKE